MYPYVHFGSHKNIPLFMQRQYFSFRLSLSTVDNVTFFMIQLIIFGLDSFYLYLGGHKKRSSEGERSWLSYANCGTRDHINPSGMKFDERQRDCFYIASASGLSLHSLALSPRRIFHAPIKFAII
jgi:hypothetical protein